MIRKGLIKQCEDLAIAASARLLKVEVPEGESGPNKAAVANTTQFSALL